MKYIWTIIAYIIFALTCTQTTISDDKKTDEIVPTPVSVPKEIVKKIKNSHYPNLLFDINKMIFEAAHNELEYINCVVKEKYVKQITEDYRGAGYIVELFERPHPTLSPPNVQHQIKISW